MAWSHFQDSNYYNKTYDYEYSSSDHFSQTVVTQINHDIGASGIISQQCKTMIEQYGEVILEMLLSQATGKICSQIGFCTFDGTRGVSAVEDDRQANSEQIVFKSLFTLSNCFYFVSIQFNQ
ncbi:aspartic proteinase A1-like isoform X1 [Mercurialis annua]|uniref:aspartic proteinase A1-like isoform X1 n=1 Tax=Mercurialis annua TaxID=3986 RepID=UPI00215F678A|nr:aspartic proteinase A1-like isoform X1 [Mercurialis annua]